MKSGRPSNTFHRNGFFFKKKKMIYRYKHLKLDKGHTISVSRGKPFTYGGRKRTVFQPCNQRKKIILTKDTTRSDLVENNHKVTFVFENEVIFGRSCSYFGPISIPHLRNQTKLKEVKFPPSADQRCS